MADKIRWGILGTGTIAHTFARAIPAVDEAEIIAVGSRRQETASAFGVEFGIPHAHDSYEALAANPEVDVVYVATPHPLHAPNTRLCLEAGKAVLCEKPFTVNAQETRDLIALSRARGVFLMEAMWSRFLPAQRQMLRWLQEDRIGEVRMLEASFGYRVEDVDESSRLLAPELAGGALLDVGVYPISLAALVYGEAPEAIASLAQLGGTGVDEQAAMVLRQKNGALAVLSCAVRTETRHAARIYGTRGHIELQHPFWCSTGATLHVKDEEPDHREFPHDANGFEYQIREVCACLQAGKTESAIMPLDTSLAIMETMDAIRAQWNFKYPFE